MLVRRRVEEHLRAIALEDLAQLRPVTGIRKHRDRGGVVALVDELALDLEQRRLALVEQYQARRSEPGELAAELRADRAAGARDEDRLALDVGRDEPEVDLDLLTTEHIFDLNRPDLCSEVEVTRDQLVQARQRLDRDLFGQARLDDLLAHAPRCRRDRDQHLVRLVVAQQVLKLVGRAEHLDAVDAVAPLARIVVDETDRRVVQLAVAL